MRDDGKIKRKIKEMLLSEGAVDVGFCKVGENEKYSMNYAVSIVVPLEKEEYFKSYEASLSVADRLALSTADYLKKACFDAVPVRASTWSVNGKDGQAVTFSLRSAAVLSGLGTIGKSSMFIYKGGKGSVLLSSVLTDCAFEAEEREDFSPCEHCDKCVKACPSGAITGVQWHEGIKGEQLLDAEKCAAYMRKVSDPDGKQTSCGICLKVCPYF